MTLQEIFDQLSHGELSQVFIGEGGEAVDGIRKEDRLKILSHIKLGLTKLFTRFLLREGTMVIGLVDGKQSYILDKKFAASNDKSTELVKYIQDTDDPYTQDLLKIERVYDADGLELSLNIIDDPDSIRTTSFNSLIVPTTFEGSTLTVIYRAKHPEINEILAKAVPFKTEIEIPPTHLDALLLFIASRVHNPIGISSEFHDGNNYAAKYEQACQELEKHGYNLTTSGVNERLELNGWV
jgi:hypothetical protein